MLREVRARAGLLPYLLLALTLLIEAGVLWPPPFGITDHLILWYVGHLLVTGRSPYDGAAWVEAAERYESAQIGAILGYDTPVWPYPPWTGYLFAPFGALPVEIGPWALHLAFIVAGIVAAVLFARTLRWSPPVYALALVVFATFQPFLIAARWGQFSAVLLLGATLVIAGLRTGATFPLVAGALVLSTKPHLTAAFGVVVLVLLVRWGAWRSIGATALALGIAAGFSMAAHPQALATMASGASVRFGLAGEFASSWALALDLGGGGAGTIAVGAAIIAATAAACLAAARWAPADRRVDVTASSGLVLSIALTPYLFSYDHLLLAPAALLSIQLAQSAPRRLRALHLGVAVVVVAAIPWIAFFVSAGRPTSSASAIVPPLIAFLLAASALLARRWAAPREEETTTPPASARAVETQLEATR